MNEILLSTTGSSQILCTELIQELWSGYGSLSRITTDKKSVILKLVKFPVISDHPRGWNSDISHKRKAKSYNIESNWYEKYNDIITDSYTPRLIASGENRNQKYLIIEDLKIKNFSPKNSIKWAEVKLCLKWLAKFHSHYLNKVPKDLWTIGTYWHLATRPDELDVLEDMELKEMAPIVDKKLNCAKNKTFVHGDAKLANFLFNNSAVAAVDFQYVGGGVGVKDVAYFLSSIYGEAGLHKNEAKCLDYYFKELNDKNAEKEWRELYPYAWCDFLRFLKGWSPEHYKINSYSDKMKKKALQWT